MFVVYQYSEQLMVLANRSSFKKCPVSQKHEVRID